MGLYDFTFYDVINRNAKCFKEKDAWLDVDDTLTLSFEQFKVRVDRLATGLQTSGVIKGDRIGVLGKNSLEYFLLYGACAALGAIMLPINWRLSADEAGYNLNDGKPKLVFVDEEFQPMIEGLKEKLPSVEKYFVLSPDKEKASDFLPSSCSCALKGPWPPCSFSWGWEGAGCFTTAPPPLSVFWPPHSRMRKPLRASLASGCS